MTALLFLLLPRLGLWSRDKAAKGTAVVAIAVGGRIDAAIIKGEGVGEVSSRVGPRGPVITVLASDAKLISIARSDIPAPHKEKWTKRDIIRITIHWASTSKTATRSTRS